MKALYFSLVFLMIYSCNQSNDIHNKIIENYDTQRNLITIVKYKFEKKDSMCILLDSSENVLKIENYINDTINGKYWEFYENGFLKYLYDLHKGKQIGSNYEFHPNGVIKKYKNFDKEGKLAYIRTYDKYGIKIKEEGSITIIEPYLINNYNDSIKIEVMLATPPNCTYSINIQHLDSNRNIIDLYKADTSFVCYKFIGVLKGVLQIESKLIDIDSTRTQNFDIMYPLNDFTPTETDLQSR